LRKSASIEPSSARSGSASAKTIEADFPPISNESFFRVGAAAAMIARPVFVSPVNEMRSTPGWRVRASPAASGPKPWTTFRTPSGSPASAQISASFQAVTGLCSAGFSTAVHPNARAGATFHVSSISGKFHGVMSAATPRGSRST